MFRSHWFRIAFLLLAAGALYLLGNGSVSLWDRDEPRYAQTSKQMLDSGDWIFPKLLDEPRLAKPIFIYWCQASAMKLFGATDWSARLPSVLATLFTLAILAIALTRRVGPQRARWTVFIYATSGLVIAAGKMCVTDAVLNLFVLTSLLCLYEIWRGRANWLVVVVFGLTIGFAGLTKGPVVLGVLGMTCLVLWAFRFASMRNVTRASRPCENLSESGSSSHKVIQHGRDARVTLRRFTFPKILLVIAIITLVVSPWIIAMERRTPGYLWDTLYKEVIARAGKPQEGHKGPPGFYLLTVWGTYFPWSLLLPATVFQAWKRRRSPAVRFALAAVVGPWVMFEIVQTKLPHYVLPTFAPLAFLTADMLTRSMRGRIDDIRNKPFFVATFIWACIVVCVAISLWLAQVFFPPLPTSALAGLFILTALAIEYGRQIYLYFRAHHVADAALVMGIGMLVICGVLYGLFLPNAPFLRISPRVAQILREQGATNIGDVMMIDYKETSLAFYQGGTIRPQRDDDFLSNSPASQWPRWVVITDTVWKQTPMEIRDQWLVIDTVHGWSYADGGRILDVLVLRKRP